MEDNSGEQLAPTSVIFKKQTLKEITPAVYQKKKQSSIEESKISSHSKQDQAEIVLTKFSDRIKNWIKCVKGLRVLEVTCNDKVGQFHRNRFGSGSKGKCIHSEDQWLTPNEFETYSGRSTTKDWKRSLRCQGYLLMHLVNAGVLSPHAASCACSICSGDKSISAPIRLHKRIIRRKQTKRKVLQSKAQNNNQSGKVKYTVLFLPPQMTQVSGTENNAHLPPTHVGSELMEQSFVPQLQQSPHISFALPHSKGSVNVAKPAAAVKGMERNVTDKYEKMWTALESNADTLVATALSHLNQAQQLKQLILETKAEVEMYKQACIEDLQQTYEYEKHMLLDRIKSYESTSNTSAELGEVIGSDAVAE